MKVKTFFLVIILAFPIANGLKSCSKDDAPSDPISQLPTHTQTGENTFGCLLDGQAFLPSALYVPYNCFYQYVDRGFYFWISATNRINGITKSIYLGTERLQISENNTYILKQRVNGNAFGGYFIGNDSTGEIQNNYTSSIYSGKIIITKLDFENHIVSGTFWFDVKDSSFAPRKH